MAIQNLYYKTTMLSLGMMLGITAVLGGVLASNRAMAEDSPSVVDQINLTVPVSCSLSDTDMDTHIAELHNTESDSAIGESTITAYRNDINGFPSMP